MTTLREAAQQALEALEETQQHRAYTQGIPDSITALRAALEQPEQEPVAWRHWLLVDGERFPQLTLVPRTDIDEPLYTRPPRRREWQRLTNEEMYGLYRRAGLEAYYPRDGVVQGDHDRRIEAYARAVEAALKERNA